MAPLHGQPSCHRESRIAIAISGVRFTVSFLIFGRSVQDRARVAGKQEYEVGYASKKTGKSRSAVKKAVKKVGNGGKKVEKRLGR